MIVMHHEISMGMTCECSCEHCENIIGTSLEHGNMKKNDENISYI